MASHDTSGCGSFRASYFKYTGPSAGTFTLRAGCYSTGSCGGTRVWKVSKPPSVQ